MELNDLLAKAGFNPKSVVVFRHSPPEPALKKVFPWLAEERPELFNAYQQTHGEKVEGMMLKAKYVASFIEHDADKALFVGLYSIGDAKVLSRREYWQVPAYAELKKLGMKGLFEGTARTSCLWFDLEPVEFYSSWKGKLIVGWPGGTRTWKRWADRNSFPINALLRETALVLNLQRWDELVLAWSALQVLPAPAKLTLAQWRGVYYIYDQSDKKSYVGSAYGDNNILGRWQNYSASGDGGNALLRGRNPEGFLFSILQRVSPDMPQTEIVEIENRWKDRLHTRESEGGLNKN